MQVPLSWVESWVTGPKVLSRWAVTYWNVLSSSLRLFSSKPAKGLLLQMARGLPCEEGKSGKQNSTKQERGTRRNPEPCVPGTFGAAGLCSGVRWAGIRPAGLELCNSQRPCRRIDLLGCFFVPFLTLNFVTRNMAVSAFTRNHACNPLAFLLEDDADPTRCTHRALAQRIERSPRPQLPDRHANGTSPPQTLLRRCGLLDGTIGFRMKFIPGCHASLKGSQLHQGI
jgi:hypothetical protein